MNVAVIDAGWFFERGYLHDATVTAARIIASNAEVRIDDEWANERGLSKPENERLPVILSFISAVVLEGSVEEAVGGWLSELVPDGGGRYRFVFTDRDVLVIQASVVIAGETFRDRGQHLID